MKILYDLLLVAAGGGLVGVFVPWLIQKEETARRLLSFAMSIQELKEAWILDGVNYDLNKISDFENHPLPEKQQIDLRLGLLNVELRTVLDESLWTAPEKMSFKIIQGRRTWIVRNEIKKDSAGKPLLITKSGRSPGDSHPSIISSKGMEELASWIEQVASEFYKWRHWLTRFSIKRRIDMLYILLHAVATEDRRAVLDRWLTGRAKAFLEFYDRRYLKKRSYLGMKLKPTASGR